VTFDAATFRPEHFLWEFEDGVATMLKSMDQYKDAPLWTVDKIADATKDWFKYLDDDNGSPQKASS